jgi:hypothetical protein
LEGLLTGCALLHAKDSAPIVGVDNRDINPFLILQEPEIALPVTVATVTEIVSYLSSRGNTSFLDIDE